MDPDPAGPPGKNDRYLRARHSTGADRQLRQHEGDYVQPGTSQLLELEALLN